MKPMKILVFGGTGFVGSMFVSKAVQRGHEVVAISRRTPQNPITGVRYVTANAVNESSIRDQLKSETYFDACVHAIGLLFDSESKLLKYNRYASGSGSVPDDDSTYDKITRQTAFNALTLFKEKKGSRVSPFLFISAAEAGWTFRSPVAWLEKYLTAKRAVESKLLSSVADEIRPVIFRPSLIWTMKKPVALFSVVPFYIGNFLGLPFVDRPVTLESLTDAMITSLESNSVNGIQRYAEIDSLSAQNENHNEKDL